MTVFESQHVAYSLELPDGKPNSWLTVPAVATEIHRRVTGHSDHDIFDYFSWKHGGRRFERALFLNRTDFWLEHRLYFELRLFTSAVTIHEHHLPLPEFNAHYSNANASAVIGGKNGKGEVGVWFNAISQRPRLAVWDLDLEKAQAAWLARYGNLLSKSVVVSRLPFELPIRRLQLSESGQIPEGPFDLVVNFMGGQSITHPDRFYRAIYEQMVADGILLNFDYVGPHRYQYSVELWEDVRKINQRLPDHVRQTLEYPRISDMLARKTTDAVHSELTSEVMRRYFTIANFRPLGGAIAHPLISQNPKLFGFVAGFDEIISDVLSWDWDYLCEHPESTLVAYWTATPKHAALTDCDRLAAFTREEQEREEKARKSGGYYYPETPLHRTLYPHDRLRAGMAELRGKVRGFLKGHN
jgi:hypothetical protein